MHPETCRPLKKYDVYNHFCSSDSVVSVAEVESAQPGFSLPTQNVAGGKSDEEITAWSIDLFVCEIEEPESSFGICIFNAVLAGASVQTSGKTPKAVPNVLLLVPAHCSAPTKNKNKVSGHLVMILSAQQ